MHRLVGKAVSRIAPVYDNNEVVCLLDVECMMERYFRTLEAMREHWRY